MAIASLLLHTSGRPRTLLKDLRDLPEVVEAREAGPDKVAAVLESPSAKILETLQKARNMPGVWNLELVYVNYEDDLDAGGHMDCPPAAEKRLR